MAGLGGVERELHRLAVAHFASQDHVWVLAEGSPEGAARVERVLADPALGDRRLVVGVDELDRVFDGDHVGVASLVDVLDHGGQGRGLAAPGRARHEHDPVGRDRDVLEDRGQAHLVDGRGRERDQADHCPHVTSLVKHVDAEARHALDLEAEVDLPLGLEALAVVVLQDRVEVGLDRGVVLNRELAREELAAEAHQRGPAVLEDEVGAIASVELREDFAQLGHA